MMQGVKDWLWRLDCIQQEVERLTPTRSLHILFTLKIDDICSCNEEHETFPFGRVVSTLGRSASKYMDPDTGALSFDLEGGELSFVVHWPSEVGWSVHDSMPKGYFPNDEEGPFLRESLEWCRWYYLRYNADGEAADLDRIVSSVVELEEATLEACDFAPSAVLRKVGNLSAFGCWPTALFYLAMKRLHPLIQAYGNRVSKHGPGIEPGEWTGEGGITVWEGKGMPKAWNRYNDRYIMLSPDLASATCHAFDLLRKAAQDVAGATDGEPQAARPGEPAGAGPSSHHPARIGPADPEKMAHMPDRGDDASRAALACSAGKGTGANEPHEPPKDADGRAIVEEQLSQVPKHAMAELLFVLAQTYHSLLESFFFSPINRTDLELNGYYLWVVDNLRHLVKWPELRDFGTAFEPVVPDLLPPSRWGTKWEGDVAASSMRFLAQAQQYCSNLKRPCPDDEPASKAFLSHFLSTCEEAIKRAHQVEEEAKEVYAKGMQEVGQADTKEQPPADDGQPFYKPAYFKTWNIGDDLLRKNATDETCYTPGKVRRQEQVPSSSTLATPAKRTPRKPKKGHSTKGKPRPVYRYSEPDTRKRWPERFADKKTPPPKS